jgi:hypothetical protein
MQEEGDPEATKCVLFAKVSSLNLYGSHYLNRFIKTTRNVRQPTNRYIVGGGGAEDIKIIQILIDKKERHLLPFLLKYT